MILTVKQYQAVTALLRRLEGNVLKLMRHPDSTDKQLNQTRELYMKAHHDWAKATQFLQSEYPNRRFPWNHEL